MMVNHRTAGTLVERERFFFGGEFYIAYDIKGFDGNVYPGPTVKRNDG